MRPKEERLLLASLRRFSAFHPCFLLAGLAFAVVLAGADPLGRRPETAPDLVAEVEGRVATRPRLLSSGRQQRLGFELRPTRVLQGGRALPYPMNILVSFPATDTGAGFEPALGYGDRVRFSVILERPGHYLAPGVISHDEILAASGMFHLARLKSPLQLERIAPASQLDPRVLLHQYASSFERNCSQYFNKDTFKLVMSVFLGEKGHFEAEELDQIRNLGILHLFVVSGFHISMICGAVHFGLRRLGWFGRAGTLASVWCYVVLVGTAAPTLRAAVMVTFCYLLLGWGLRQHLLNGLGIAALLTIVCAPHQLLGAGFQFSYLCLIAIGFWGVPASGKIQYFCNGLSDTFQDKLSLRCDQDLILSRRVRFLCEEWLDFLPRGFFQRLLPPVSRVLKLILALTVTTAVIQILTLPLSLYYSNLWSWMQVPANLALIPLFGLFVPLCLTLFLLFPVPGISEALGVLIESYAGLLLEVLRSMSPLAAPHYYPQPGAAEIVFHFGVLAGASCLRRRLSIPLFLLTPIGLLLWLGTNEKAYSGNLEISMLDVGQAETLHLRYPGGASALIDAAGQPSTAGTRHSYLAERVIGRYLWAERIRDLQYVLISHRDADHAQGLWFLEKAFPIGRVICSVQENNFPQAQRVKAGYRFQLEGVDHLILHPSQVAEAGANAASLVLLLRYGEFSMLFTGDIDAPIEGRLAREISPVDILKVAHHGSATSSSAVFLGAAAPKAALVSAGRHSMFDHPAPLVRRRFGEMGIPLFSTAEWGTMRIVSDGVTWKLFHFRRDLGRFVPLPFS